MPTLRLMIPVCSEPHPLGRQATYDALAYSACPSAPFSNFLCSLGRLRALRLIFLFRMLCYDVRGSSGLGRSAVRNMRQASLRCESNTAIPNGFRSLIQLGKGSMLTRFYRLTIGVFRILIGDLIKPVA
jgi:hypothetical protein